MVATVTGNSLGLSLTSLATLNGQGSGGNAALGRSSEGVYVNTATGNLVVQDRDGLVVSRGFDALALRTYNSQGLLSDDNADNWSNGIYTQMVKLASGTLNAAGSTLVRTDRDGAQATYTYNATLSAYVSSDGVGAFDRIVYETAGTRFTWTDGDSGLQERYDASGKITASIDPLGGSLTYAYTGNLLTSVTAASGEKLLFVYAAGTNNLVELRTVRIDDPAQPTVTTTLTRVRYTYNNNRLETVTVELTPEDLTDAKTYVTTYAYTDATSKRIKTITQTDGSQVDFVYAQVPAGGPFRVTEMTQTSVGGTTPVARKTTFAYDTTNRKTTVTDPLSNATVYTYDATPTNRLISVQGPTLNGVAQTFSYAYNASGDLTSQTDAQGNVTTYGYDANGNQTSSVDALGNTITRTFSAANKVLTETLSTTPVLVAGPGLTLTGGTAIKTGTTAVFDAGFRSDTGYLGGAAISFVPSQANKSLAIGLNTDPSSDNGRASIDWVLHCTDTGTLTTYQNGDPKGQIGTYVAGDVLGVAYDGATIKYYKNGVVLKTVNVVVTQPLYADASFYSNGAQATGIAFAPTLASLTPPVYITSTGITLVGSNVSKTGSSNAFDAGFRSATGYLGPVAVSFSPAQANKTLVVGLNTDPATDNAMESIDWGFYLASNGNLSTRQSGADKGVIGTYVAGDVLGVAYDGVSIKYYKNGVVLKTVVASITQPLYADSSFNGSGAQITGLAFGTNLYGLVSPAVSTTTRYIYDANNLLRYVIGAEGRVTEYAYNGYGQQVARIDYADASYAVSTLASTVTPTVTTLDTWRTALTAAQKQATVRVDTVYDFRGHVDKVVRYNSVDATGTGVTAGASTTQYVYDQAGNLLKTIEPKGVATTGVATDFVTQYFYDGLSRVYKFTDALGVTTLTDYQDANAKTVVTLANGLSTTRTYNKAGELIGVLQSDGATAIGTSSYAYDKNGNLRRITDPTGLSTYSLYDTGGRKVADIDATGSLTEYVYNQNGLVIRTVRYANAVSSANLASLNSDITNNLNAVTLATVRPALNATSDRVTRLIYDKANRLAKSIDELGFVTETQYDVAGRVLAVVRYDTALSAAITPSTLPTDGITQPVLNAALDRRTRLFYDAEGLATGSLDAEGYLTENQYDSAGRLVHTVRYATITSGPLWLTGTLAQLRPAANAAKDIHTWTTYNAQNQVLRSLDGEGYLTVSAYDLNGNQTLSTRYNKSQIQPNTLTSNAQLTALVPITDSQDRSASWTYTDLNQVKTATDFQGTVTQYTYDNVGQLTRTDKAFGTAEVRVLQTRYDKLGRVVGELTAEGSVALAAAVGQTQIDAAWSQYGLTHAYDAAGRRISTTDQNGAKTLFFYNADGDLAATINALGQVTETKYNALNQAEQTTVFGGRLSAATLATLTGGQVSAISSAIAALTNAPIDARTSQTYTLRGQLDSATDARTNTNRFTYNAYGELASTDTRIDAAGTTVTTAYTYDRLGQLKQTVFDAASLNITNATDYDAFGRAITRTDGNLKSSSIAYDRLGRVVQTTDPLLINSTTTYDAFDRTLTLTDGLNNTTSFAYDKATRTVTMTAPEGIQTVTTANRHGETVVLKNGNQAIARYDYDLNGRLKTRIEDEGAGKLNITTTNTYDRAGRLKDTAIGGTKTAYTYDALDRVLTRSVDPGGLNLTTVYNYDPDTQGQRQVMTDPSGVVTTTRFDLAGNTTEVAVDRLGLNLRTQYTYDPRGKTLTVTQGAGSTSPQVTKYEYDRAGRLSRESRDPLGLNLTVASYSYDKNDNVVNRSDGNGNLTRITYDADNRVVFSVNAAGEITERFYDANGNVTAIKQYFKTLPSGSALSTLPSLIDTARDRITRYTYDAAGRQVYSVDPTGAVTEFTYDATGNVTATKQYAVPIKAPLDGSTDLLTIAVGGNSGDVRGANYVAIDPSKTYKVSARLRQVTGSGTIYIGVVTKDAAGNVIGNPTAGTFSYAAASNVVLTPEMGWVSFEGVITGEQAINASASANKFFAGSKSATPLLRYNFDGSNGDPTRLIEIESLVFTDAATGAVLNVGADMSLGTGSVSMAAGSFVATYAKTPAISSADVASRLRPDALNDRITRYTYDAAGRQVYSVDPTGAVTEYTYDATGKVTATKQYAVPIKAPLDGSTDLLTIAVGGNSGHLKGANYVAIDPSKTYKVSARLRQVTGSGTIYIGVATKDAAGNILSNPYSNTYAYAAASNVVLTPEMGWVSFEGVITGEQAISASSVTNKFFAGSKSATPLLLYNFDGSNGDPTRLVEIESLVFTDAATGAVLNVGADMSLGAGSVSMTAGSFVASYAKTPAISSADVASRLRPDALNDRITRYTYDAAGRQVYSVDATGAVTEHVYDAAGNVTAIKQYFNALPSGSALSTIPSLTDTARDRITRYTYDAAGRQVYSVDATGAVTEQVYDAAGNVTAIKQYFKALPAGNALSTIPTLVDAVNDRITRYTYDAAGRQVYSVDATGAVTEQVYDAAGNVTAIKQYFKALPAGNALSTIPTLVDAVNDRITRYTYDAAGRQVYSVDATGAVTEQVYDAAGNVTAIKQYFKALPAGNALSTIPTLVDAVNDRITRYTYDGAGRVQTTTDALGFTESCTYDGLGNKTSFTNKKGSVWTYTYDAAGRLKTETSPQVSLANLGLSDGVSNLTLEGSTNASIVTKLDYDAFGNISARTEAAGRAEQRTTTYRYDALNRQVRIIYPVVQVYTPENDAQIAASGLSGQTQVTLKALEARTFYDAFGNAVANIDVAGGVSYKVYDAMGRVRYAVDAMGYVTEYQLNAFGEVSALTRYSATTTLTNALPASAASAPGAAQVVNAIATATDLDATRHRTITTTYDAMGRVNLVTEPLVFNYDASTNTYDTAAGKKTQNTYNAFGDLVQQAVSRTATTWTYTAHYYDKAGRQTDVVDALGNVTRYAYDAVGNLTQLSEFFNKVAPAGQNTWVNAPGAVAANPLDRITDYTYDKGNRKTREERRNVENWSIAANANGNYNPVAGTGPVVTTYGYDAVGNLTRTTNVNDINDVTDDHNTYSYYDAVGRVTAVAAPVRASTVSGAALTPLTLFKRDAHGNVIARTDLANGANSAVEFTGVSTTVQTGYPATVSSGDDRTTLYRYNVLGKEVQNTDATGVSHHTLYNERGDVAKTWQGITSGAPVYENGSLKADSTLFKVYQYDKLGRLIRTVDPAPRGSVELRMVAPQVLSSAWLNWVSWGEEMRPEVAGTNTVATRWSDLIDPRGDVVRVRINYLTTSFQGIGPEGRTYQTPDTAAAAASGGITFSWDDYDTYDGGISQITYVTLEQRVNGVWVDKWHGTPPQASGDNITLRTQSAAGVIETVQRYNAFGELISRNKGIDAGKPLSGQQEYYKYDNAGRLWGTNSGDGVDRVLFYDLQGHVTSVISSSGSGAGGADTVIANLQQAGDARTLATDRRTDLSYDALGHLTKQVELPPLVLPGDAMTVRPLSAVFGVASRNYMGGVFAEAETYNLFSTWSGDINRIEASWSDLSPLGGGDVRMTVEYETPTYEWSPEVMHYGVWGTQSRTFAAQDAATGASISWWDGNYVNDAGIGSILRLKVEKRDANGRWVEVINRTSSGAYGSVLDVVPSKDGTTITTIQYLDPGSGAWVSASVDYGDFLRMDTSRLPLPAGTYRYRVVKTPIGQTMDGKPLPGAVSSVVGESTFVVGGTVNLFSNASTTVRPTIEQEVDRWGNVTMRSDVRNANWKTYFSYDANNQLTSQTETQANGTGASGGVTTYYHDKLGRQIGVKDARGNINGQRFDAGGNLIEEFHADGGRITHLYDAFGNRVRSIDAIGNDDASKKVDHTTAFTYDKAGRLLTTSHAAVAVYGTSAPGDLYAGIPVTGGAMKILVETNTYDQAGRKISQTNAANETTRYRYDMAGHVIETIDALSQSTEMLYDRFGYKVRESDALGFSQAWTYDYFGQLTGHTDLGGAAYRYVYDNARQLKEQTNTRGQSLRYGYDIAGHNTSIIDAALNQTTTYVYDLAGRRTREKTVQNGVVYQDNHLTYDALGRLRDVSDGRMHIGIEYDLVGNRTRINSFSYMTPVFVGGPPSDRYFQYDKMNRQVVVDSKFAVAANNPDAALTNGNEGAHVIRYDKNGNRTADIFWGNRVTVTSPGHWYWTSVGTVWDDNYWEGWEYAPATYSVVAGWVQHTYSYDLMDRLSTIRYDNTVGSNVGTLVDYRYYDAASRLISKGVTSNVSNEYIATINANGASSLSEQVVTNVYDKLGRLTDQRVHYAAAWRPVDMVDNAYLFNRASGTTNYYDAGSNLVQLAYDQTGSHTNVYTYTNYKRFDGYMADTIGGISSKLAPSNTNNVYDSNGHLVGYYNAGVPRTIVNDASGFVLAAEQGGALQRQVVVNGEVLARYGYADGGTVNDFNFSYDFNNSQGAGPGRYTVQAGDTLRAIARAVYGDATQWYLIAAANGLAGEFDIRAGQTLTLPDVLAGTHNNVDTLKPYDPSHVNGDVLPNLPARDDECGHSGRIMLQVVAMVVKAVVQYYSGSSTLGAFVGSLVGQVLGREMGAYEHVDWNAVGTATLAGLVEDAVPIPVEEGSFLANPVVQAAVTSAVTQGIFIATGIQDKFSWRSVAMAMASAGINQGLNKVLDLSGMGLASINQNSDWAKLQEIAIRGATGFASTMAASVFVGGKLSARQVAVDAFGNAVAASLAGVANDRDPRSKNYRNEMDRASEAYRPAFDYNYRNGMDVESDDYPANVAGVGLRPSVAPGLRLSANAMADWSADVDRGIRDKALGLANFESMAAKVWAAEGAQAAVDAQTALRAQHGRADAYAKELESARAREQFGFSDGLDARDMRLSLARRDESDNFRPQYAPSLGLKELGDYLNPLTRLQAFGKGLSSVTGLFDGLAQFVAHPIDSLEQGGLAMQASARQYFLSARSGDFTAAARYEGQLAGEQAAGMAIGYGAGKVVGFGAKALNATGGVVSDVIGTTLSQEGALTYKFSADQLNAARLANGLTESWLAGESVTLRLAPIGERYNMVVSNGQALGIAKGEKWFGNFATTQSVPSQTFARNRLVILEQFKPDVSHVVPVELTAPQWTYDGLTGPIPGNPYIGRVPQTEFRGTLGAPQLRPVGPARPLSLY